jgi:hypothetical protein
MDVAYTITKIPATSDNRSAGIAVAALLKADYIFPTTELARILTDSIRLWYSGGISIPIITSSKRGFICA